MIQTVIRQHTPRLPQVVTVHQPSRLSGLLLALALGIAPAAESTTPAPAEPTQAQRPFVAQVRGLGELRVERHAGEVERDGGSWITIAAGDAQHAGWAGSKFLADATAVGPVRTVADTGLAGTVLTLDRAGWWLLGIDGNRFQVLFAKSKEALAAQAVKARASSWLPIAQRSHPAWLDCFDNASVGFWVLGGGVLPKDLDADMKWFADKQLTMCATGVDEGRLVAPGVLDTTVLDWYTAKAKQHGVPYRMLLGWAAATRPGFVRDIVPLPHVPPQDGPSVVAPVFDRQNLASEVAFEPVEATDAWVLDARRRIAERAAADPWFIGHHASPELAGSQVQGLDRVAALPETKRAWQGYLRDDLKLDLRAVSLRHTGTPDAYRSWEAVPVPVTRDFAGWDSSAIDLRGMWEGHADREKVGAEASWFDSARAPGGWVPVDCNDAMLLLYSRQWGQENNPSYWLRKTVDIPAERAGAPLYLHVSRSWWHGTHGSVKAWLNGKPLKDLTSYNPVAADGDLCLEVGDAAVAGANTLVLDTRGTPIASYIFLSPNGRQSFPHRSEALNRLYFDATNFLPRLRAAGLENAMAATRAGDPYRPMKVMAPAEHVDALNGLYDRYGAYPHDTGQTGVCWAPWTTSAIQARGGQHSSEPGSPAGSADELRNFFAFYLMLGNDAVDIVFHDELYRTKPELSAWIDSHRQLMACVGKMERVRPSVAVLRSNRTTRLGIDTPFNVDLTRGELQACGRAGQLVDLPDVASGVADAFPVLFDAGTEVMTEADVTALERYVRGGGTYIALHNTGMHSEEKAYAWPISRLTGLTVKSNGSIGGKRITFSATEDLFPAARGRSLDGWGMMLDWMKRDVGGTPVSLDAADGQVEAIATWQDGLGIAVGRRKLGKGQVITLGSTFWRDARDIDRAFRSDPEKSAFLDQLLTAVGAPRQSATASPDVWAEQWRSKNGLFDLYPVAYMRTEPKEPVTGDVSIARGTAPAALWEVSRAMSPSIASAYEDGRIVLRGIAAEPMVPRVFAAPREDIRLAPLHWLEVQGRQWAQLPAAKKIAPPPAAPQAEVVALVDGWRTTTADSAGEWTADPTVSAGWSSERLGTFAAMGHPEDSRVRCFRREALPAAWKGQRIRLVFDCPAWFWGLNPSARLWAGGKPLAIPGFSPADAQDPVLTSRPDNSFSVDVTDRVRDGVLDLAIEIDSRKADDWHKRPSGVTGVLYLKASAAPVSEQKLDSWFAATDVNVLTPVPVGQRARFAYLETRFTLPKAWPGKRLLLTAPGEGLHHLVINNVVVVVPQSADRLDVSKLVRRDGENVLRWLPFGSNQGWPALAGVDAMAERTVPGMVLGWWP